MKRHKWMHTYERNRIVRSRCTVCGTQRNRYVGSSGWGYATSFGTPIMSGGSTPPCPGPSKETNT